MDRRNFARALLILSAVALPVSAQPRVSYKIRIDSARTDAIEVTLRLSRVPETLRLAMKVHPEYDARAWRDLEIVRVDDTANDATASAERADSTLWRVHLPGGRGRLVYRVRVTSVPASSRRAWQLFVRATGALINPPDVLLYLPDFPRVPAEVHLDVPQSWGVATALAPTMSGSNRTLRAPNAATLLDAPILLGALRHWSFREGAAVFCVHYWPLPDATPFDTAALLNDLRTLTHATMAVFGSAPFKEFHFLFQDGAGDALEHASSVTVGVPSDALAHDPRARLTEIAHEFFHSWNLVAIHPDGYNALNYLPASHTSGLWMGEGVTLYYADALRRRAGLADSAVSRLDWLAALLSSYHNAWWKTQVSPERASLAFGDSPVLNPDATGSYYLQGELLAVALDALVRDSTHDARSLDAVMRGLLANSRGGRGFTSASLEAVADSVCQCRLTRFFADQVRGAALIDIHPALARIGMQMTVDTAPAVGDDGTPVPDQRIGPDFTRTDAPVRLVVTNAASAWARAGLRTGDELVALNGVAIATPTAFLRALRALRIGDRAVVDLQRDARALRIPVSVAGYTRASVHLVPMPGASSVQLARRARWLDGW